MSKNNFSLESQTDWERLDAMTDEDIDFSDIPELTAEQLQAMKPVHEFFAEHGISFDPKPPYTVTVYHEDQSTTTHLLAPIGNTVVLDADVQSFFPDSETVNRVLRSLISLIPKQPTN
jgi:hypothetical protein